MKRSQVSISFNVILTILISIMIFIIVFRLVSSFISYSEQRISTNSIFSLQQIINILDSQPNLVRKIDLNKQTEFFFDGLNLVIPTLKRTVPMDYYIIASPKYFKTNSLVLFSKESDFPLPIVSYIYLFPRDYKFIIYNSTDSVANELFSLLPDTVYDPTSKKSVLLIKKVYADDYSNIKRLCKDKKCFIVFCNSKSSFNAFKSSFKQRVILIQGDIKKGNVTFSDGRTVTYFDKLSLLTAIILDDYDNYNLTFKKIKDQINRSFIVLSERLDLLFPLQTEECKNLLIKINNTYFQINNLIQSFNNDQNKVDQLYLNYTLLNKYLKEAEENECFI